jgi:hypothetical protein
VHNKGCNAAECIICVTSVVLRSHENALPTPAQLHAVYTELLFRPQIKGAAALLLPRGFSNMNIMAKRLSSITFMASMQSEHYPSGYTAKLV